MTRWWVSSLAFENDIKVDASFFDIAGDGYRKIRNTLRFLLSNLSDLPKVDMTALPDMLARIPDTDVDAYILGRLDAVTVSVRAAYEGYHFKAAHKALYDFCNDDLSSFYCTVVKDRLYCDAPSSDRRRQTQYTMWMIVYRLCRLLAPILPHTADEAFSALLGEPSYVLLSQDLSFSVTVSSSWDLVFEFRSQCLKMLEEAKSKGLENSLDAGIQCPPTDVLDHHSNELADICGVSRVDFVGESMTVTDLTKEPRCERSWRRDATVKQRSNGSFLSDRDAQVVGVS